MGESPDWNLEYDDDSLLGVQKYLIAFAEDSYESVLKDCIAYSIKKKKDKKPGGTLKITIEDFKDREIKLYDGFSFDTVYDNAVHFVVHQITSRIPAKSNYSFSQLLVGIYVADFTIDPNLQPGAIKDF